MLKSPLNYRDPTAEMLENPIWNAIWNEIKYWDIGVPAEYSGYSSGTGNHATAIYLAIHNVIEHEIKFAASSLTKGLGNMNKQVPCDLFGCPNTLSEDEIPEDLKRDPHFCSLKCASRSGYDMHWSGKRTERPTYIRKDPQ